MKLSPKNPDRKRKCIACPECGGASKLLYTRTFAARVVRRRECSKCGKFTTIERPVGHSEKEKSVGVTALAEFVTDFMKSSGLRPADLLPFVTIPLESQT